MKSSLANIHVWYVLAEFELESSINSSQMNCLGSLAIVLGQSWPLSEKAHDNTYIYLDIANTAPVFTMSAEFTSSQILQAKS